MTQENWSKHQQLMACLLLSESLWRAFEPWISRCLTHESEEAGFRVWVLTIQEYFQTWSMLPPVDIVSELGAKYVSQISDHESMAAVHRDCLAALKISQSWTTAMSLSQLNEKGRGLLGSYLEEQISAKFANRFKQPGADYTKLVDELRSELTHIRSSLRTAFRSAFPDNYFPFKTSGGLQPVGIDFVDMFCAGGLQGGEVVGHAAPIGQGKTTLVAQICHARSISILHSRIKAAKRDKMPTVDLSRLPQVYFFSYENVENLLSNYISNAATIPREVCMEASQKPLSETPFSSMEKRNWRDWERRRWSRQFEEAERAEAEGREALWPKGDMERFKEAVNIVNSMVQLVDFSGHEESHLDYASRGINGMQAYIREHQDTLGNPGVDFVAVDFVGAMADMAVSFGTLRNNERTDMIRTVPQALGQHIAGPLRCPVWAAHQLNPGEQNRAGGTIPDATAAEGSKLFLTYCAIGVASGVLTKDNVAVYKLSKHRRMQTSASDVYLGRLDKTFARWVKADNFVFHQGMVMPKREAMVEVGKVPGQLSGNLPQAGGFNAKFVE